MTENGAKGFVQGKLDCMKKCDVFNKEDKHRNNECELCEYCYSQGNFGQQKEAFSMAINALEKQIPKNPIEQIRLLGSDKGGKCPSCNKYINNCRHWMYCECGQKIDWSDNK